MNPIIYSTDGDAISGILDISGKLIPNLWAFITQLIAFSIMVAIVIFFAYKPVRKYLDKRQAYIKENLDQAAKSNKEAQEANQKAQLALANSKKEGAAIILEAKKQAEEDKVIYEEKLQKELQLKRIRAEQDIQAQKRQAIEDAKGEIVDIALMASSSLLGREVNSKDNKEYVAKFVEEMQESSQAK